LAVELVGELETIDKRIKTTSRQLKDLVAATGSGLMTLNGIGPSGAARLLGDVGDIARFPTKAHFASWNGTAPLDASSGDQNRHRLSRAGNRRINRVLHIMAVVQLRHDTEGRAYFRRKVSAGKTSMEAMRCLKRRLSDAVYRQMTTDAEAAAVVNSKAVKAADPGGQAGTSTGSSAADSNPNIDTSEKSLPGPATTNLRRPRRPLKTTA
jgi:transposase